MSTKEKPLDNGTVNDKDIIEISKSKKEKNNE